MHTKNKTMSNIGIIEKMSERQNRMKEKYFNKNGQFESTQTSSNVNSKKENYSEQSTIAGK
jgi:hypothetical protein